MGTSSLYGGPKKSSLLPSDYNPDDTSEQVNLTDNTPEGSDSAEEDPVGDIPQQDRPEEEQTENHQEILHIQPSVSWGTARSSMRKAMGNRSSRNVKGAIRNYTKALGGHTNAIRQATKVRKTAFDIYSFFSGTPEAIRKRFEDAGIKFEGRTTRDIFNDICSLIAPIPNDLEDSLTNMALQETIADVAADESIDLNQFDSFNEELLQNVVGGLIKHYIFDKLIMQSEQTALKHCESITSLRDLEKAIKKYIDGIVDSVVPTLVKNSMTPEDFNRALEILFDVSYQQMEELR